MVAGQITYQNGPSQPQARGKADEISHHTIEAPAAPCQIQAETWLSFSLPLVSRQ